MSTSAFLLALSLSLAFLVQPPMPPTGSPQIESEAKESVINLDAFESSKTGQNSNAASPNPGLAPTTRTETMAGCQSLLSGTDTCEGQLEAAQAVCPDDFVVVDQMEFTYAIATGVQVRVEYNPGYCPNAPVVINVSEEDFQRLPLVPSELEIQPASLEGYVNLPVFIHTSDEPQVLTTTILGTNVLIEATPHSFAFDYGDGESRTTSDPGQQYPDTTNAHTYVRPGAYATTLTTAWTGRFSVNGGSTWQTISGTATTQTTSNPIEIVESVPLLTN